MISDRIRVRFSGHGAGIGDLSWGQQSIWRTMQESRSSITQGLASPVPPGFTVEDMATELRFIMNRYPTMRTRLRFDADGTTRQAVEADGEIAMEVVWPRVRWPSAPARPRRAVLLAAFAVALSRVTAAATVATKVLVNNRFRGSLAETVSPIAQPGLLVVDLDGAPARRGSGFGEALARTQRATLSAYKNAYYDPRRLRELLERVGRERGEEIDLACLFNDRRVDTGERPGPAPTGADIRSVLPETTLRWAFPTPGLNEKLLIVVNDAPGAIAISAMVDTDQLAPDNAEALLRGMEETLVGAVIREPGNAGDQPPDPVIRWSRSSS